jgi:hypothetical protein
MFIRDGEGNSARARTNIEDAHLGCGTKKSETALDDDLRLGPWDERTPVNREHEPPEAPFSEDVRKRFALSPSLDERA